MSQRATSFIINCGPSMQGKLLGHDKTAFQEGMEIIMDSVGEKVKKRYLSQAIGTN
jgi:hypothetical protein